jgi:hypothetical protein
MKLPVVKQADRYVGLYVVDFGESSSVGFTAEEVAKILDSERYKDCKVYKIHRAYPDGRMELKGVRREQFQLEAGMLFYEANEPDARNDFKKLINTAVQAAPPCRAKVQLAKYSDDKFATAVIYPAEYDDEVSRWLLDNDYKTKGAAEGGTGAVQRYYQAKPEILERHQLFSKQSIESRTGEELLANLKIAVQRRIV